MEMYEKLVTQIDSITLLVAKETSKKLVHFFSLNLSTPRDFNLLSPLQKYLKKFHIRIVVTEREIIFPQLNILSS